MREEEFWQAIYVASIRAGHYNNWAAERADTALEHYQKKFKATESKPINKPENWWREDW